MDLKTKPGEAYGVLILEKEGAYRIEDMIAPAAAILMREGGDLSTLEKLFFISGNP